MKKIVIIGCVVIASFLSNLTHASAVYSQIESLMVDRSYSGKVYINLKSPVNGCGTNPIWEYVLDVTDDFGALIYTNLLTLYASGKSATFTGNENCTSVHNGIEGLRRVELK